MIDIDINKRIKTYSGIDLLQIKTSFTLNGITQILGHSGAGKSTFLKIIAGLVTPDKGSITVDKKIWLDTDANIFLKPQERNVGFVFQDYALFPNMTVGQHLLYGTRDNGYIMRLVKMGEMESFLQHKPRHLSGGQQQRLAILRALSTKPKILLMDEPFSALDNSLRSKLITELKQLIAELSITCLVVTHQPFKTGEFADYSFKVDSLKK